MNVRCPKVPRWVEIEADRHGNEQCAYPNPFLVCCFFLPDRYPAQPEPGPPTELPATAAVQEGDEQSSRMEMGQAMTREAPDVPLVV